MFKLVYNLCFKNKCIMLLNKKQGSTYRSTHRSVSGFLIRKISTVTDTPALWEGIFDIAYYAFVLTRIIYAKINGVGELTLFRTQVTQKLSFCFTLTYCDQKVQCKTYDPEEMNKKLFWLTEIKYFPLFKFYSYWIFNIRI